MKPQDKLKVLMLGWDYLPALNGGLGVATYELKERLAGKVDLDFVVPHMNPSTLDLLTYAYGGAEKRASSEDLQNWKEDVEAYIEQVLDMTEGKSYDVIHAHDWLTFIPALELQELMDTPFVAHVHATSVDRNGKEERGWDYEIEKEAFEKADQIVTVSEYERNLIEEAYDIDADKIQVTYNAITDVKPFRRKKGFQDPLVVFAGRLTDQKGPFAFLDAASELIRKGYPFRFVIAGEGPLAEELMILVAERGYADRIMFTGFLPQPELFELFAMGDYFVMPSRSEPFGIVALEAARFGLPCLISRNSGVLEVLTEAYQIEPDNSQAIENGLLELYHDEGLSSRMGRSMAEAAASCNWEAIAEQWVDNYQSLQD
jgi:glycosyltransferase involved in cell wall biosynthesis